VSAARRLVQLLALATHPGPGHGQCSECGQWFEGWPGGICEGCK
jgi:hypothetical protein